MTDEEALQRLEQEIPARAGAAFAKARQRVLASGQSVLSSKDGVIYRVFPDGTRVVVKEIAKPIKIAVGTRLKIQ